MLANETTQSMAKVATLICLVLGLNACAPKAVRQVCKHVRQAFPVLHGDSLVFETDLESDLRPEFKANLWDAERCRALGLGDIAPLRPVGRYHLEPGLEICFIEIPTGYEGTDYHAFIFDHKTGKFQRNSLSVVESGWVDKDEEDFGSAIIGRGVWYKKGTIVASTLFGRINIEPSGCYLHTLTRTQWVREGRMFKQLPGAETELPIAPHKAYFEARCNR